MQSKRTKYSFNNDIENVPIDEENNYDFPFISWGLTIIWLIVIILFPAIVFMQNTTLTLNNLQLNEIGDYLAGVAAPLAFFWLVYGYYQQGKELKINNRTLQLQYKELKNSVAAQNLQAASMEDQAKSLQQQLQLVIREKYYPKFILSEFEYLQDEQFIAIYLKNTAHSIFDVNVSVYSEHMILLNGMERLENDYNFSIQTMDNIPNKFDILFTITFLLENGDSSSLSYKINYSAYLHTALTKPELEITIMKEST